MNCIQKINKKIKQRKNLVKIHNTSTYSSGFSEIQNEYCDKQLLLSLQFIPEFDDTYGSGSCCQILSESITVEWNVATLLIKHVNKEVR